MGILIDSSVLIAWERDRLDLQPQLEEYTEEDFAISAITASELLHGVHRAANPQRRRREAFVEGLLARLPILFLMPLPLVSTLGIFGKLRSSQVVTI
jgi:tRNA(fMet)-specific endonuclease VapC